LGSPSQDDAASPAREAFFCPTPHQGAPMPTPIRPMGHPEPQGLYDPLQERDACGLGFVAHAGGAPSHRIVEMALELLNNLSHRGAAGSDPQSGDGAGILLQVPHRLLARDCAAAGLALPEPGTYGVGMLFLPA